MEIGANQSTVSRRIGILEEELRVRLFRRNGRGVGLTERGEQLLKYASALDQTLRAAHAALRNGLDLGPERLCIAAQPTIARIMFGKLGHTLKARYPNTRVRFVEGLASHILSWLSNGEVDLSIMYVPEHPGAIQFDLLLSERVCLVTPASVVLPNEHINVSQLGDFPLILPSTHHGLRVLVESLGTRHGFVPNVVLECDGSISITKRLVLENCGYTILPSAAVSEEVAAGRLKCFPLRNPIIQRDVAITWPQNRVLPDGLWEVTRMIRQQATEMILNGGWPGTSIHTVSRTRTNTMPSSTDTVDVNQSLDN